MLHFILGKYRHARRQWSPKDHKKLFLEQGNIEEPITVGSSGSLSNLASDKSNVQIGKGFVTNSQITVFSKGKLKIGPYTYMGNSQIICANDIEIGSGCFFSERILIFDGNHHPLSARQRMLDAYDLGMKGITPNPYTDTCEYSSVKIEDAVWIGINAVITSGVVIGKGSIVGAGAVVTKDIPAWSVAVGNPARVIKTMPEEDLPSL